MCYSDQVLGTWNISVSSYDHKPYNDNVECSSEFKVQNYYIIKLISPNVAIDQAGFSGTWTMTYTQSVEIQINSLKLYFDLKYVRASLPKEQEQWIDSYCNESMLNRGWGVKQGVSRGEYACLSAVNFNPSMFPVLNHHKEGELPSQQLHPLNYHKLKNKYPIGKTYHHLKKNNALLKQKLSSPWQGDDLPETFDWRNVSGTSYVPKPFDQMWCGSCYACASVYMYMLRIRVATNNSNIVNLSIQHTVDCNFYSQGCDGGFDQSVSRFAEEFGIRHDEDYTPYTSNDDQCDTGNFLSGKREFFQSYNPLGGYYGAVYDPLEMQWELKRNGPFVVSVMVEGDFPNDPYGDQEPEKYLVMNNTDRHYYITESNHAVLLIGWTNLPDGHPAWIIQNSWGEDWNDDGTFLLARGVNAYGVESSPGIAFWREKGAVYYDKEKEVVDWMAISLATLFFAHIVIIIILAIILCISKKRLNINMKTPPE